MLDNKVYSKMFTWLFVGLLITFISGYCLSMNEVLLGNILKVGYIPIIIVELVIAVLMGFRIRKMNPITSIICYLIYSITTGITFGVIFVVYKLSSIMSIFLATSILFGIFALIGYTTKKDLTKLSTILFGLLLAIIITSLLNVFIFKSNMVEMGISALGVVVFLGYIMYDINKVKYLMNEIGEDKAAIYGAFQLYLDFINLFIRLLRFFGKEKD